MKRILIAANLGLAIYNGVWAALTLPRDLGIVSAAAVAWSLLLVLVIWKWC